MESLPIIEINEELSQSLFLRPWVENTVSKQENEHRLSQCDRCGAELTMEEVASIVHQMRRPKGTHIGWCEACLCEYDE